jgi:hypothetical protein
MNSIPVCGVMYSIQLYLIPLSVSCGISVVPPPVLLFFSPLKLIPMPRSSLYQGRIQDFKLRGAQLKKLRRAEGGANIFGVFRVNNHDFTPKNHIFSNFRGGARRVRPPPGSAPDHSRQMVHANVLLQNYCPTNTNTKYKNSFIYSWTYRALNISSNELFYQHVSFSTDICRIRS